MDTTKPFLQLYVGSLGGPGVFPRQEDYLDRLESLVAAGAISGYEVTVWGDAITPISNSAHTPTGRRLLHQLFVLEHWCRRNGAAVEELFTVEPSGQITLEPIALVEYDRSRVKFVSPYRDDRHVVSIDEHIDALGSPDGRLVPRSDALTVEDPARSGQPIALDETQVESPATSEQRS